MTPEELYNDIMANREALILREDVVARTVRAEMERLILEWIKSLRKELPPGTESIKVTLARRARILQGLNRLTKTTLAKVKKFLGATLDDISRSEFHRHRFAVQTVTGQVASIVGEAKTGVQFGGIAERNIRAALAGKIPGLADTPFAALGKATERAMRRELAQAIADGKGIDALAMKWSQRLGAARVVSDADSLARTAVMAASNNATMAAYQEAGPDIIRAARWEATFDQRTCFVENTEVMTRRGLVPIQDVAEGDFVFTHRRRWRRVNATFSRWFSGPVTKTATAGRDLVSTWDHAIWVVGRGWSPAGSLSVGDSLAQLRGGKSSHNVTFLDSEDQVSGRDQEGVLSHVSGVNPRLGMPVVPIRLNDQSQVRKEEVDRSLCNSGLLSELDADGCQLIGDRFFKSCSRLARVIARRATMDAVVGGCVSEDLSTGGTGLEYRRPVTDFGAVFAMGGVLGASGIERVSATGARDGGMGCLEARIAPGESLEHGLANGEPFATTSTLFVDERESRIARSGTENPAWPESTTMWDRAPTASTRFELDSDSVSCSHIESVHHSEFDGLVYCLAVDEDETFFANGVLVHNCLQCSSRHGQEWPLDEFPPIPAHLRCRCVPIPVFTDARMNPRLGKMGARVHAGKTRFVRADRSFSGWLRKQPPSTRADFFPSDLKRRAWERGWVDLNGLVGRDGAPVTDAALTRTLRAAGKPV